MEEMRAQLASLMESIKEQPTDFTDPEVCKYFLTGLCPHDLFENTETGLYIKGYRFSLGPCKKTHSEELRARYMEARKHKRYGYEELSIQIVKQLIEEAERKVEKGQLRSDDDTIPEHVRHQLNQELKALDDEIDDKMKMADKLMEEGQSDKASRLNGLVADLQVKRCKIMFKGIIDRNPLRLRPCDVCGALLSVHDSDKRLDEHFQGRIHVGFQKLRNILKKHLEYIASAPLPDASLGKSQSQANGSLSVNAAVALNHVNSQPPQRVDPEAIAAIAQAQMQQSKLAAVALGMPAAPAPEPEKAARSLSRSKERSKSRSSSSEHERKKVKSRKRSRSRSRSKSKESRHRSNHGARKENKHKSSRERRRDRHRDERRKKEHKERHRRKEGKDKKVSAKGRKKGKVGDEGR